jgi:hypothetical protein
LGIPVALFDLPLIRAQRKMLLVLAQVVVPQLRTRELG